MKWNAAEFAPIPAEWFRGDTPNELGPGTPDKNMEALLLEADVRTWFGSGPADAAMAEACRAALLLRWDCLEASHRISQQNPTTTGSYWHGIMHRREPDFSNAKYWFRRVGEHPVFEQLVVEARQCAAGAPESSLARDLASWSEWDPFAFVDWSARCLRDPSQGADLCRQVALLEWRLLFAYCHTAARGTAS